MIQFVLMDVEGTTTSIRFVHDVLFPYAAHNLTNYLERQKENPEVKDVLAEVAATVAEEEEKLLSPEEAGAYLSAWIQQDRKHTALKSLQGYMWREGYETGQFQGHIYADVVPSWEQWKAKGIRMGIYSSGSVEAQKLLFGYSEQGDLTPYLEAHFDTHIGHKREASSYRAIQKALAFPPKAILFLSDVTEELDAARDSGMLTMQIVRPGTKAGTDHPTAETFDQIHLP